jgi:hypothetical protein
MLKNRVPFAVLLASTVLLATGIAPMTGDAANPPGREVQADAVPASASWLSSELWLSGGTPAEHEERPAIAHNNYHDEYLVVWHNNRPVAKDIYARRVSERGGLRSWFSISNCSNCLYPAVAYNHTNDEYLVVWSQYSATQWEIWGKIIPWNGPGTNAPFQIASWTSMNLGVPAVAWNSYRNEYMVVWQTSLVSTGQLLGIGRRRLSNAGAFLSNADYITGMGTTNQGSPDLVYNLAADGYLVVWVEPGASATNVFGGRLNREGALQGNKFAVDASSNEQQKPAITTNEQDRYMVVWQEMVSGDWDIHGKEVNSATGAPLPTQYLIAILYGIDETTPDVACNGGTGEYLTVWQRTTGSGEAIHAVRWGVNVTTYSFEVAAGGLGDNENPAVACDIPGYLVAYEWKSWSPGSDSDIYGRRWVPGAVFLPAILRHGP